MKTLRRLPPELAVRLATGSEETHTAARCWAAESDHTVPHELHCDCGTVSHPENWARMRGDVQWLALGANAGCVTCGALFVCEPKPAESKPAESKPAESKPVERITHDGVVVRVEGDSLLDAARTRRVVELNDEWLDLTIRLEDLTAERRKFLQTSRADVEKVNKRIGEIRSELRNLKPGSLLDEPFDEPSQQPKQQGLPGIGGKP